MRFVLFSLLFPLGASILISRCRRVPCPTAVNFSFCALLVGGLRVLISIIVYAEPANSTDGG